MMSSWATQRCIVLGEDIGKGRFFTSTSPHLVLLCCDPGGSFSSGEPQRDAVHVVPDGMCTRIQKHEQVWGGPQEVSRDRKGEQSFSGTLLCVVPCLGFLSKSLCTFGMVQLSIFFHSSLSLAFCGDHRWPVWLSHLLHEEDDFAFICGPTKTGRCTPNASVLLQGCCHSHPDLFGPPWQSPDWRQQGVAGRHR